MRRTSLCSSMTCAPCSTGTISFSVAPVVATTMRSSSSLRRVADADLEHEPVELRLGQRIRAFLLDRVLRREHEERLGQLVRLAGRR